MASLETSPSEGIEVGCWWWERLHKNNWRPSKQLSCIKCLVTFIIHYPNAMIEVYCAQNCSILAGTRRKQHPREGHNWGVSKSRNNFCETIWKYWACLVVFVSVCYWSLHIRKTLTLSFWHNGCCFSKLKRVAQYALEEAEQVKTFQWDVSSVHRCANRRQAQTVSWI